MNPHSREGGLEVLDGGQNHQSAHHTEHIAQNGYADSVRHGDALTSANAGSTMSEDDNFSSNTSWQNREDMNGDRSVHSTDERSVKSGDDSDGAESTNGRSNIPEFPGFDDDVIWIPPEPADKEDETERIAKIVDDDDDDYGDGIKWGQSSFSATGEELETSPNPREERQKAMLEAVNGQLKILVSRFLASADMSFPKEESGESWLDILTSLSWEAALVIKPDASVGKEMDPGSYVKVKCIASGARQQSEVIKGLVFKKNAAHKHMPMKFQNPRLLLLRGVLGHSDVGLSSFNSMEQEKDHLEKTISKVIEICNPNVIMVEKTVSRDIQEILLKEGVTLILDMKLNRLERIARCTGSPIMSFSEVLNKPKLKQCDYFHIEKIVEEHNNTGEGGKRPSKTLLFLEGFPRPLGCTILLRGASSEELKKVKQVMQYTVFAAYHLILETSFFEDQRVFLNNGNASNQENAVTSKAGSSVIACDISPLSNGFAPASPTDNSASLQSDLSSCNGSVVEYVNGDALLNSSTNTGVASLHINGFPNELREGTIIQYDSTLMPHSERVPSSVSGPLGKFIDLFRHQNIYLPVTSSQNATDHQKEGRLDISQDMASNGFHTSAEAEEAAVSSENKEHRTDLEKPGSAESSQEMTVAGAPTREKPEELPVLVENSEHNGPNCISKEKIRDKDEIDDVLDSQSILILMSSQCITNQTVCEQSHLSRIKYYGNFDVSLGRYLQDILQNQKLSCSSCGEPPEAHVYSYTHRNGNLTVLVRRLPPKHHLSGESEGKIWMWTRCLRCEHESGNSRSTPRVLISTEARNLSFGKFLELSFSSHSAARRLSVCGHLVNRDCLRFFGLGSKVAMFRYSPVEIYAACKPQPTLEFYSPNRQDWFKEEVLARGNLLFSEVASRLQHLKSQCPDVFTIKGSAWFPVKEFSELEEMLIKEKGEFEDSLANAVDQGGKQSTSAHELLKINWFYQDLLLELYVWDRRLHQLLHGNPTGQQTIAASFKNPADLVNENLESANVTNKEIDEVTRDKTMLEVEATDAAECAVNKIPTADGSAEARQFGESKTDECAATLLDQGLHNTRLEPPPCSEYSKDGEEPYLAGPERLHVGNMPPVLKEPSLQVLNGLDAQADRVVAHPMSMMEERTGSLKQLRSSDWEDRERWIWCPFSESKLAYRKDLQVGLLEKFDLINQYSPSHLSPLREQSSEEMDSPHFIVGPCGNVLSVSEDEISSIISRALAISEERRYLIDTIGENETGDAKGEPAKTMEKSYSLISEGSMTSSIWSSTGSFDSEASFSSASSSLSSDEFDGSLLSSSLHPEISVNGKVVLRGKYSVVCVCANQFYTLRKKCCPSELAYITSLSRCKKWDAQGGKSKAFFAKTMDDRFIIKQIKKTEFESFLKFAPDYFKHVYQSLDTGSQTCLAKILGIYQVKQVKHGKEMRMDLMVMENLLFGHNISRTYDLKGAVFSRHVADSSDCETVYLDQNFIDDMRVSPIYIGGRTKHLLQRAIWNDTSFLTSINVMDYSLLVGVDKQRHELVFGIIDYLRQYTWDKQLETWVKTSLVVPKNVSPTVVSPKEYKKRFRKFMTKYFLTVPDTWSPEHCSGPCKFCGHSNSKLAEVTDENPSELRIEACA